VNLPNLITIARMICVPIFLYAAFRPGTAGPVIAFLLFVAASISDQIDGYLARKNDQVTPLGQFLDPLADKLLVGAALVVLVIERGFPLWAAIVIAAREIAVQILRTQIVRAGGSLPASSAAKLKTVTQIVMVSWWLLPWSETNVAHWVLLAAALVTTVWSGAEYFIRAQRLPGEGSTNEDHE
jgi:CDP-diacylglycerol---glycerol-3-phosphate 3-phosphatidyltransferase